MGYRAIAVTVLTLGSSCTCADLTAVPYDLEDGGADAMDARAMHMIDVPRVVDAGRDAGPMPTPPPTLVHVFTAACGGPVVAADINRNGRAEIYCSTILPGHTEPASARVIALAWERDSSGGDFLQIWNHEAYSFVPWHAADLDGDGRDELFGYSVEAVAFQAWTAKEPGGLPARLVLDVREPGPHRTFTTGPLDADAPPEVVFEFGLRVWELDGGRPRFAHIDRATGGNATALHTARGPAIIAGINEARPPRLVTFRSIANGEYQRIADAEVGFDATRWITAGDLDGQPGDEVVVGGWTDGSTAIQFQWFALDSAGQPYAVGELASEERVDLHGRVAALGTCEADGVPPRELIVATWSTVRLLDARQSSMREVAAASFGVHPQFLACGDTDGDGRDEIIVSAERDGWSELHVFELQFR